MIQLVYGPILIVLAVIVIARSIQANKRVAYSSEWWAAGVVGIVLGLASVVAGVLEIVHSTGGAS